MNTTMTTHIPVELAVRLNEYSQASKVSKAKIITWALGTYLDAMKASMPEVKDASMAPGNGFFVVKRD